MKNTLSLALGMMLLTAGGHLLAQDYSARGSGGGVTGSALNQGGIGQGLGMSTRLSDREMRAASGSSSGFLDFLAQKPFGVSVSIREGFDSNVNTTRSNPQESFYTNFAAGINYSFGTPRLQLQTNLSGGYTLYTNPDVSDPSRFNGLWDISAIYAVAPRLTLSLVSSVGYYSQPDVDIPGTSASQQGDYMATNTTLSGLYQWTERFSTTTSYTFNALVYVDSDLNNDQGRITQTIGQSFNFLYWPTTTIVGEYRISPTTYYRADLNSLNQFFLVGFDHAFNPRANWTTRVGTQLNLLDNPVEGYSTYFGPYGETSFNYQYGQYSRLTFTLRYGTEAAGLNNVTQRQSFRTGIGVVQGWTPRLSFSGGLFYGVNYYEQSGVITSFYENIFEGSVGANYQFNRFLSLSAGYNFTGVLSHQAPSREYARNVVFLGVNTVF